MRLLSIIQVVAVNIILLSVGTAKSTEITAESTKNAQKKLFDVVTPRPAEMTRTTIKASTGRSVSTVSSVCVDEWQGPSAFIIPGWFTGNEFYASYQDPSQTGCSNTYPFEIQTVIWEIQNDSTSIVNINMRVIIYDVDSTVPNCPKPGAELFVGTLYTVPVPSGSVLIEFGLDSGFCVTGPYFAAIFAPDLVGTQKIGVVIDDTVTVAPRACANYNYYLDPQGFEDLVIVYDFPGNVKLFSAGLSADSNVCQSCCIAFTGNMDCDPSDVTDIGDLTTLISHLFIDLQPLCCQEEGNVDGDTSGVIDIGDLTTLIDHLFISFSPTAQCQ